MADLFIKILNMSISAGWLILLVVLLRLIFRKMPKWIMVLLWGIVGLRLLLPVSLESRLSLIPSAETISVDESGANTRLQTGIDVIRAHEQELARTFYRLITGIPDIHIYGDHTSDERSPIVALNIADLDSAIVADELAYSYGIATRAGAHCAPLMHKALGTQEQGAVRFSFGFYNTIGECEAAAEALRQIADRRVL